MPNPFKRQGSSFQPGDWRAWGIGLLGLLEVELAGELPPTIALVGDIGSGKTTALGAYKDRIAATHRQDFFIEIDMGKMKPETWSELHLLVYARMVSWIGAKEHDVVAKELGVSAQSAHKYVQQHEIYALLQGMIKQRAEAGARTHVLVDECQRPAEHYERERQRQAALLVRTAQEPRRSDLPGWGPDGDHDDYEPVGERAESRARSVRRDACRGAEGGRDPGVYRGGAEAYAQ
jgi:hypothetical protein